MGRSKRRYMCNGASSWRQTYDGWYRMGASRLVALRTGKAQVKGTLLALMSFRLVEYRNKVLEYRMWVLLL